MNVLVVAPHPDDEVLGVGGTIARYANDGARVTVVIVTKGMPPDFDESFIAQGRAEAREAHALLGVQDTVCLDLPAARLDTLAHADVNREVHTAIRAAKPDVLFTPFVGDVHRDHQLVFASVLVAIRPTGPVYPRAVFAYETLSETNWNAPHASPSFVPSVYFDITTTLSTKLRALRCFRSQIQRFPSERSVEAAEALARVRGSTVYLDAAEAFSTVRQVF
jgi:LmbE family N-acetylglucosaminyl deacetylase